MNPNSLRNLRPRQRTQQPVNGSASLPDASGDSTPLQPQEPGLLASLFPNPEPETPATPTPESPAGLISPSGEEDDRARAFEQVAAQVPPAITEAAVTEESPAPALVPESPGTPPTDDALELTPEIVAVYVETAFDFLAKKDHPLWKLEKEEVELIAPPATPVLNKWAAKIIGSSPYREEVALAIVLLAILGPRCVARWDARKKPLEAGTTTPAFSVSPVPGNRIT